MGPRDGPGPDVLERQITVADLEVGKHYVIATDRGGWMEFDLTDPSNGWGMAYFRGNGPSTAMPIQLWACVPEILGRLSISDVHYKQPQDLRLIKGQWLIYHLNEEGWRDFGKIERIFEEL